MATKIEAQAPQARAKESYVRISASKVRQVLKLISGASYEEAKDILKLTERKAAAHISRCLESAVNNAENKDMKAEELFISSCFADEGATLRRWRARARGRSTRINKRTASITIIVSRYSPEELELRRQRGIVARSVVERPAKTQETKDDLDETKKEETSAEEPETQEEESVEEETEETPEEEAVEEPETKEEPEETPAEETKEEAQEETVEEPEETEEPETKEEN